jgi:hypothetical protein
MDGRAGEQTRSAALFSTGVLAMDYMHLGIIALAAVMVGLLYSVTRATRAFIESDKRRVFREVRATGSRPYGNGGENAQ